eukprot:2783546-Rhodomonas_salina.2
MGARNNLPVCFGPPYLLAPLCGWAPRRMSALSSQPEMRLILEVRNRIMIRLGVMVRDGDVARTEADRIVM